MWWEIGDGLRPQWDFGEILTSQEEPVESCRTQWEHEENLQIQSYNPWKTLKKYSDLSETVGNALDFDENQDIALIRKALESSDYLESP